MIEFMNERQNDRFDLIPCACELYGCPFIDILLRHLFSMLSACPATGRSVGLPEASTGASGTFKQPNHVHVALLHAHEFLAALFCRALLSYLKGTIFSSIRDLPTGEVLRTIAEPCLVSKLSNKMVFPFPFYPTSWRNGATTKLGNSCGPCWLSVLWQQMRRFSQETAVGNASAWLNEICCTPTASELVVSGRDTIS